jgi:hypothetical protein
MRSAVDQRFAAWSADEPQRLVALAAAWAGENHAFDIVGNCAKSDDSNESEIARIAVAFQPDLGASITKENLRRLGNADTGFHRPVLPLGL